MTKYFTAFFTFFWLAISPLAHADDSDIITQFRLSDVERALTELGMTFEYEVSTSGKDYIAAKTPDGYNYNVFLAACNAERSLCLGLEIFSRFDVGSADYERINQLEHNYSFMNFSRDSSNPNAVIMQRYLTADDGIAIGNLKVNLEVFANIVDNFPEDWRGMGVS